ncbi:MAG TPA: hypothetical protein VKG25_23995 [Bryobacteraceae bacterium]|nr:hypothetical protein [Bryobacteraceae bacterium]
MNDEYRFAIGALKTGSAPDRVEQKVLVAFRRRNKSRGTWRGLGLAAAAVIAVIGASQWKPAEIAPPAPLLAHIAAPTLSAAVKPKPTVAPVRHRTIKRAEEIATSYYPLPGADSLPSPDAEAVVRMVVPRSALQLVGFPLTEEPRPEFVRADVVFGQDGVARAIRFVQ